MTLERGLNSAVIYNIRVTKTVFFTKTQLQKFAKYIKTRPKLDKKEIFYRKEII